MSISKELTLAILALDAYNRGYGDILSDGKGSFDENGVDLDGLGGVGSRIGLAEIISQSDVRDGSDEVANGFYAVSYTVGAGVDGIDSGTTVISYRGTDNFW